eukprot:m.128163 g.128163  ORF g.128163 m.128163 type:complete len:61 (+) comp17420_c0_seq2:1797-1979(+)
MVTPDHMMSRASPVQFTGRCARGRESQPTILFELPPMHKLDESDSAQSHAEDAVGSFEVR